LHFRLLITPIVVTILAVRAGIRDAREGRQTFVWAFLAKPNERRQLVHSALKDVGRVFLVAVVLDTAYQVFVLHALYIVQLLIVAGGCAVVPYVLIRGLVTLLTRALHQNQAKKANGTVTNPQQDIEGRD
jgi:hypothetical protein